jgi:hypothetical protein
MAGLPARNREAGVAVRTWMESLPRTPSEGPLCVLRGRVAEAPRFDSAALKTGGMP